MKEKIQQSFQFIEQYVYKNITLNEITGNAVKGKGANISLNTGTKHHLSKYDKE